jgi:hypothetical protein
VSFFHYRLTMKETKHTCIPLSRSLNHEKSKKHTKKRVGWFHHWSILKMAASINSPFVTGESPYRQVDFLLDARPLTPRQKILLWTLTFLYHKYKLSKKKREERRVPFY